MTSLIVSSQNVNIKKIASLQHKKYRDIYGEFTVEGLRLVEEALRSDWEIELAVVCSESQNPRLQEAANQLSKRCPLLSVTDSTFEKLADTESPQGILVVVKQKKYILADELAKNNCSLWVILDNVQDPGNVGTIIRTADAAGCSGIIMTSGCADAFSGKTVRASMGSIFHLPIISNCIVDDLVVKLRDNEIMIAVTALEQASCLFESNFPPALAIVFGNEANGVSKNILNESGLILRVPIFGAAESLNVASSAAVVLYEVIRQRQYIK